MNKLIRNISFEKSWFQINRVYWDDKNYLKSIF